MFHFKLPGTFLNSLPVSADTHLAGHSKLIFPNLITVKVLL